jgi:uncharacterized protein
MSHQGSLLILPSGMRAWRPARCSEITPSDFDPLLTEREMVDFLLIGTGTKMARLSSDVTSHLTGNTIRYDILGTSAAVHTYNVVLNEGRRVAAALIAVANAHER